MPDTKIDMEDSDRAYLTGAELFAVQRLGRKQNLYYQRFETAAAAIKFAMEDMPVGSANVVLETDYARHDAASIAALYASEAFPLERRSKTIAP